MRCIYDNESVGLGQVKGRGIVLLFIDNSNPHSVFLSVLIGIQGHFVITPQMRSEIFRTIIREWQPQVCRLFDLSSLFLWNTCIRICNIYYIRNYHWQICKDWKERRLLLHQGQSEIQSVTEIFLSNLTLIYKCWEIGLSKSILSNSYRHELQKMNHEHRSFSSEIRLHSLEVLGSRGWIIGLPMLRSAVRYKAWRSSGALWLMRENNAGHRLQKDRAGEITTL